jgi:aryl-alcohol dehydrogenase-like predicted oxidoreductase
MRRVLGKTGMTIIPPVLGGNVFGWTLDERASFEVLDAFHDHGGNAIDTADIYAVWAEGNRGGESETILGKWLHENLASTGNWFCRGNRALRRRLAEVVLDLSAS